MEYACSFEVCNQQGALVGGLYGVAMGKAFFGESMFHTERDASKVALVYLIEWMKLREMELLDTQYITDHLKSLGGIEITQEEYLEKLLDALR
jgi:leucyl/phenylalanyl-tRNA--protein transferase